VSSLHSMTASMFDSVRRASDLVLTRTWMLRECRTLHFDAHNKLNYSIQ
jgi:hypothetical protein